MSSAGLGSNNWSCRGSIGARLIEFGEETMPRKSNQVDLTIALIRVTCILPGQNDQMNSVHSFGHNSV